MTRIGVATTLPEPAASDLQEQVDQLTDDLGELQGYLDQDLVEKVGALQARVDQLEHDQTRFLKIATRFAHFIINRVQKLEP